MRVKPVFVRRPTRATVVGAGEVGHMFIGVMAGVTDPVHVVVTQKLMPRRDVSIAPRTLVKVIPAQFVSSVILFKQLCVGLHLIGLIAPPTTSAHTSLDKICSL